MVWNGLKIVCKNDVRMVWPCWFWSSMNGWDLKYYIGIWKVEKNGWKKMKWNGIVWRIWKVEKNEMEWNERNG